MNRKKRIIMEAFRGFAFLGMLVSGFFVLMSPIIPIQDATRGQANTFRLKVGIIMGTICVVCAVVRSQCARRINQAKLKEQAEESPTTH